MCAPNAEQVGIQSIFQRWIRGVMGMVNIGHAGPVILEHALLPVKPGEEVGFESAFAEAKAVIATMPGFLRLTLSRCRERPSSYLLLVEWDRLEDHTEGFRGSPQYQEWRRLLHRFYEPFPVVEHYEQVNSA
jgi:heme-degrading monooxygenase HmoA